MKKLLSALVFFFGLQTFAFAQGLPAPSVWQNQRGSFLFIQTADPVAGLTGWYINEAQGFQCQGVPYQVVGQVTPGIQFTVNFAQCNTVTVWNGQLNGPVLNTTWVLNYPGGTQTGADQFYLLSQVQQSRRR
jgi:Avidin family